MARKAGKARARKKVATRNLAPRDASQVKGGKAGRAQQEYLIFKMADVIVTSVQPSGAGDGASTT